MTTDLARRLLLPLSFAAIVSLALAYFFPLQGLFVNLATTFIGILLTVFYVDWILREHEKRRWAEVKYRVNKQITRLAFVAISQFRTAFRFGTEILDMSVFGSDDPNRARAEIARMAENTLMPVAPTRIEEMTQADWKTLSVHLRAVAQTADQLIALYGDKIDPGVFSLIVDVQEQAYEMLWQYSVAPDVYGVPDEQLPVSTKGSIIETKRWLNKIAANQAQELLSLASSLLRKLQKTAP